jgi:hypothetical protein
MATKPDPFLEDGDPEYQEQLREQRVAEAMAGAVMRMSELARDAVQKRKPIEERWLNDLRLYYGRYDEMTEKNLQSMKGLKSRAFIPLARAKTNLWEAELGDRLFPADDRNWGIGPTPVPDLVESAEKAKRAALEAEAEAKRLREQAAAQQAQGADPNAAAPPVPQADALDAAAKEARSHEDAARETMAVARKAADAMQEEMDDQLSECLYPKLSRDIIADACRLGVGVAKGPFFSAKPRMAWRKSEAGENVYELAPVGRDKAAYRRVDPWHYFPDPNASDKDSCEYELERHVPNKRQLRKMAKEMDFDRKAVRELLEGGPGHGALEDLNYIAQIRSITNEGQAVTGRYVVWEYHGSLECDEVCALLRGLGRDEDADVYAEKYDPLDEIRVIVFFCDGRLLKVSEEYILDSGESLYSVFSFEKSDGSILGALGIPAIMADPLAALNAAWRMMLDNAALSVGPQVVIDKTLIQPEDGDWKLAGRKVWECTGAGDTIGKQNKPFETFDIPMRQDMLAGIIDIAMRFIDEVTGLTLPGPEEQKPAAQTLGGMAMAQNAKNVVFRRVVKNFDDDYTTPNIRRLYDFNMQFSDKEEIKGDMKAEARGTSALLVKEIQSQHLMVISQNWSTHPVLGVALKVYDAMRMTLQSLSINADDLLIPKDDFEQKLKDMAQAQPSPEEIRAEASRYVADTTAQSKREMAQSDERIAEMRMNSELARLASVDEQHRDKILAMMTDRREERAMRSHEAQADRDSSERIKAVEIGIEQEREARAEREGYPAFEASGKGVG